MSSIRNVLVGVDVTKRHPPGAGLDPVAEAAVRRALWVGGNAGAAVTFMTVLPALSDPSGPFPPNGSAEESARRTLTGLVRRAGEGGVEASAVLAKGDAWVEIVRQVRDGQHDLLVIGTHDPHGLRRLFLGSTARKLLHECACPVWVSKPGTELAPRNVLVASDLLPHSDEAVRLGIHVGRLAGAHTHLLHAVEYPLDRRWADPRDGTTGPYHRDVRAEAERLLRMQAERNGGAGQPLSVHAVDRDGMPDHAILKFVAEHQIDLLVLGTAARHGLPGYLLGNTAERLLPEVPCSLLAVRHATAR